MALALGAAFLQNLRSALQKSLTGAAGVLGATYARFLFAAPLAAGLVGVLAMGPGALPVPTPSFALWALAGGLAQIGAQLLLLRLFTLRNFAVGNAFARTETVQAVLLGLVLLGDGIGALALAGILISALGVVLLSARSGWRGGLWNRAAGIGIAAGTAFALSGVAYRGATLALAGEAGALPRAAVTLACVTIGQALLLSLWMRLRAPGRIGAVLGAWRVAVPVGVAGMLASLGWFAAFALAPAAEVKAVGQAELVMSYLTARLAFGERPVPREIAGMALVAAGILVLLAGN